MTYDIEEMDEINEAIRETRQARLALYRRGLALGIIKRKPTVNRKTRPAKRRAKRSNDIIFGGSKNGSKK